MISNGSAPGSAIKQLEDLPSVDNQKEFNKLNSNLDSPISKENSTEKNDDDFGNFEFKGESLLKLVQPELENLAENWYAALRDHALLSLPPGMHVPMFIFIHSIIFLHFVLFFNYILEYNSQLPHDGGAFYTADTVEGARGHYHEVWPALLHAMALHFNNYTKLNLNNGKKFTFFKS